MLPAVAALAVGILIAGWRTLPLWFTVVCCLVSLGGAVADSMWRDGGGSVPLLLSLMFLGMSLTEMHHRADVLSEKRAVYLVDIDQPMLFRDGWWRGDVRVCAMRNDDGAWLRVKGRVQLYADTTVTEPLRGRITLMGRVLPFRDSTGRYRAVMLRRGYVGSIFFRRHDLLATEKIGGWRGLLASIHAAAVERISRLRLSPDNLAVAEAVAVGERRLLTRDVREEYSRSGMAHLLALSGLHVGIVFAVVNALLLWMPLIRRGHRIGNIVAIATLWLYMLMTGFPPSAVRAALMFSLLQISLFSSASYSSMNALAMAAFVSLCWNVDLIYDVGFQLSYIAVCAILLWAVPLCQMAALPLSGRMTILRRLCNTLSSTMIIGLVATLATAPLVSHHFGIISIVGFVMNPIVIQLTAVAITALVVWLFVPIAPLNGLMSWVVESATDGMNLLSGWLAEQGWASVDVRIDGWLVVTIYLVMVACTVAMRKNMGKKGDKWVLK